MEQRGSVGWVAYVHRNMLCTDHFEAAALCSRCIIADLLSSENANCVQVDGTAKLAYIAQA
jgi:hypothetical protein